MTCSSGLDLDSVAIASRLRSIQRSMLLTLLGLLILLPAAVSAQQGKCFNDSNGRKVCCDTNGNCK